MWDHINCKLVPLLLSVSSRRHSWMSTGYHSEVSARSLEEDTKQSVSVCGKLKETLILAERGGSTERAAEWERDGFNDAENWPVTVVHPSGKSLLQLAVNLSVPLSSHLAPPTPRLCLTQSTPPPPHLTLTQLLLRPPIQNFHLPAILTLSP